MYLYNNSDNSNMFKSTLRLPKYAYLSFSILEYITFIKLLSLSSVPLK